MEIKNAFKYLKVFEVFERRKKTLLLSLRTQICKTFKSVLSTFAAVIIGKEVWKSYWNQIWREKSYSLPTLFLITPTTILQLPRWWDTGHCLLKLIHQAKFQLKYFHNLLDNSLLIYISHNYIHINYQLFLQKKQYQIENGNINYQGQILL